MLKEIIITLQDTFYSVYQPLLSAAERVLCVLLRSGEVLDLSLDSCY